MKTFLYAAVIFDCMHSAMTSNLPAETLQTKVDKGTEALIKGMDELVKAQWALETELSVRPSLLQISDIIDGIPGQTAGIPEFQDDEVRSALHLFHLSMSPSAAEYLSHTLMPLAQADEFEPWDEKRSTGHFRFGPFKWWPVEKPKASGLSRFLPSKLWPVNKPKAPELYTRVGELAEQFTGESEYFQINLEEAPSHDGKTFSLRGYPLKYQQNNTVCYDLVVFMVDLVD